jgi:hypothetical protein
MTHEVAVYYDPRHRHRLCGAGFTQGLGVFAQCLSY